MGFLDRFRRKPEQQPPSPPAAPEPAAGAAPRSAPDPPTAAMIAFARERILTGDLDHLEVAEHVADAFALDFKDPRAVQAVREAWTARLAEQASWPSGSSDYERVAAAFDELNRSGMVARMNFTCCNTCGTDEIDAERTPLPAGTDGYGYVEDQYVFYHQQDAERIENDAGVLYLTYSSWRPAADVDPGLRAAARDGDEEAGRAVVAFTDAQVGARVVAALRAHGLTVAWNGNPAQRIELAWFEFRPVFLSTCR